MSITVGGSTITMNSGAVVQDPPGSASCYLCRSWVNFNGTGSVSANQTIRASGNVSSVFKNSAGNYTVNFSTAMSDDSYTVTTMTSNEFGSYGAFMTFAGPTAGSARSTYQTTSSFRVFSMNVATTTQVIDKETVCLAVFR